MSLLEIFHRKKPEEVLKNRPTDYVVSINETEERLDETTKIFLLSDPDKPMYFYFSAPIKDPNNLVLKLHVTSGKPNRDEVDYSIFPPGEKGNLNFSITFCLEKPTTINSTNREKPKPFPQAPLDVPNTSVHLLPDRIEAIGLDGEKVVISRKKG